MPLERTMCSFVLLGFIFTFSLTWAIGPDGADNLLTFAAGEESLKIPCDLPSIKTCSSINWSMGERFPLDTEVVKTGKVQIPKDGKYRVLKDCSLEIAPVLLEDAQLYMCSDGVTNKSVSLWCLEIKKRLEAAENTLELHCYLNVRKGFKDCGSNSGVRLMWTNQDNSRLQGDRFSFQNSSTCLSKLIITKKKTDHHRTWKCQVFQNDQVKASTSYTSTIKDGLEEVFAAVGESVSLPCSSNFSFTSTSDIKWTINDNPLTNASLRQTFQINKDSLVINKVNSLHAGDYQCLESSGSHNVLNTIRLHTLDVTEEFDPEEENLNLTCILTCAEKCEADFNLTWSERNQNGLQSSLTTAARRRADDVKEMELCSPSANTSLVRPSSGALVCTAVAVYMYMKRKQKTNAAEDSPTVEMGHVYEIVLDEVPQRPFKNEPPNATYDLLQPVN
ncbi:hypothetical protein OJAV_G00158140 [Oryzias javanicus]|uniref:Ig-like domain-containing protein n=1 Tax=Oryzias javanicus TaxID=123683 RepID=A0A437CJA2_ORYJA|nr:hypothetical protein OJAV_G00158140 [Oryzias javanicus]